MFKYFHFTILIIILFYLSILLIMFFFQRSFMYHPSSKNYIPEKITFNYEEIFIPVNSEISLKSWSTNIHQNQKTILFFHGNAGDLDARIYKLNVFDDLGINFLIISWRGFSGNQGKPTEKGLYEDANSAVKWLNQKGIKNENIILYGESLGTGIAVELSSKNDFGGVILESPYTSMVDMGKKFYPFLPVSLMQRDRYNSIKKIKKITSPILILHGKADNLVPFYMGVKLFNEANEPKSSYFPTFDGHMMKYDKQMLEKIDYFIKSID